MTPRPCVKRECSAVGKTQRALWSWLIRRSRWSQAVSSRSSSATSSAGSPAAADSSRGEPLGQLDVAVDRVADEVDGGERLAAPRHGVVTRSPRSWATARRSVPATSSRSPAGPRTSTSSPHDRIQSRISMGPATVARHTSEPSSAELGLLGRVPGRLEDAGRDARPKAQHDVGRLLVRDDVPAPVAGSSRASRARAARRSARSATVPDPLHLECPQALAALVPADEVERVGLG